MTRQHGKMIFEVMMAVWCKTWLQGFREASPSSCTRTTSFDGFSKGGEETGTEGQFLFSHWTQLIQRHSQRGQGCTVHFQWAALNHHPCRNLCSRWKTGDVTQTARLPFSWHSRPPSKAKNYGEVVDWITLKPRNIVISIQFTLYG